MSVQQTLTTAAFMQSVITLKDLLTAAAIQATAEMVATVLVSFFFNKLPSFISSSKFFIVFVKTLFQILISAKKEPQSLCC